MKRVFAAFALLGLSSCATTPPVPGLAPYCSSEGAFGVRFGPDPNFSEDGNHISRVYLNDPAYAPFTQAEIVRTLRSGIIQTINGRAEFYDGRRDGLQAVNAAVAAYDEMRARIEGSGAFATLNVTAGHAQYASIGPPDDQVRLWLGRSVSTVTVICIKVVHRRQVVEELPQHQRQLLDEWREEREQSPPKTE